MDLKMAKRLTLSIDRNYMKKYIPRIAGILYVCLTVSCEQKIAVSKSSLTSINPLSYTDVVYKSNSDTVLVSGFDGKITEIINHNDIIEKRLIIDLKDEIYSLAYNYSEKLIYASTLNQGIVVINEQKASVEKILPIGNKWAIDIHYNPAVNILLASGYTESPYIWETDNEYNRVIVPEELDKMQPKAISDQGTLYFDGFGVIGKWNIKERGQPVISKLAGRISDTDNNGRVLTISDKRYILKNINSDSILSENKHPDWPIYVSSKDTTVRVPVSLPLTDALLTLKNIYSSSIDKSIRVWDIKNGELVENLLWHKATISALSLSQDETQLVSVDLKGGIKFWDLKND